MKTKKGKNPVPSLTSIKSAKSLVASLRGILENVPPEPAPKWSLERDLNENMIIRHKVMDSDYAKDLYASLCNMQWKNLSNNDGEEADWSCSWRYSGGVIADLRQENEDYLDFYCAGNEGIVTEEIEQDLKILGWKPIPYEQVEEIKPKRSKKNGGLV